jgi:4-hydroxy-3-methylbut-2-enyl diphosphate reductase
MFVIGGRDSANTRHLAEVAREEGVETYHVESAGEIQPEWLDSHQRVGISAGASTPDDAIDAVVARLRALAPDSAGNKGVMQAAAAESAEIATE